jgi:hypothetical protein
MQDLTRQSAADLLSALDEKTKIERAAVESAGADEPAQAADRQGTAPETPNDGPAGKGPAKKGDASPKPQQLPGLDTDDDPDSSGTSVPPKS